MPKISETIDLTKEEYEKMEKLRKELNFSIHDFLNIAIKETIRQNCVEIYK